MGSIVHYGFLHRVEEAFGEEFLLEARKVLLGQKVQSVSDLHISGLHYAQDVVIGGLTLTSVYEWVPEEALELEVDQTNSPLYRKAFLGHEVIDLSLLIDRDDELLLAAKLDNNEIVEIKIGVYAYEGTIDDWMLDVIGEARVNEFFERD